MKRILFLLSLTLIGSVSITLFLKRNHRSDNSEKEQPGYAEQFQLMKQNEHGVIPSRLWKQWSKERRSMLKAQFFSSVKELGPSNIGGRTRAIIVDKADKNRLISGGVSGGIWISTNAGSSWSPLDDAASTLSVTAITQSPFEHNNIYYSTGELSSGVHINYDGNGIFKSVNGGNSFEQLPASDIDAFLKTWDIEHSLTDSNTLYVATVSSGLWRSTDAGESFHQIFKSSTDINDVDAMPDGTVYFSREQVGLYKFMEADTLQIEQVTGTGLPPTPFGRVMIAPSPSNANILYMAFGGSDRNSLLGLYKTTDAGKNWNKLTNRSGTSYYQIWHNFLLEVHPTNPDIVIMAGVEGEFSTNGGGSWKALLNTHSDYHDVAFVPGGNDFYTVSDGGVYRCNSATASTSAVNCNGNYNITQLYAGAFFPKEQGEKVIVGAQDNWTTVNTTGSNTFTQWLGGDGAWNAVDATGTVIYASSQNGNIRRRSGNSWVNIYTPLASKVGNQNFWFINPFEIHPNDGSHIYFPTKNQVARSDNSGTSWTIFTNSIPGNIFSLGITPETNPTIYIGGMSSLLYRTKNANSASPGDEFKMFTLGPAESRGGFIGNIEVDPNDKTTIYLAMSNASTLPRIWKVKNADSDWPEWVNISSNLPESLPVNWIEVDPKNSNHIMVATDYGLYVSTNGGAWWEKEDRVPNVYVSMLKLRETDRKLFVFTFGRGVWVADLEENIFNSVPAAGANTITTYPNPAATHIVVSGLSVGKATLYNLTGTAGYTENFTEGKIDVSSLRPGTYMLSVTTAEGAVRNTKVLIQR